MSVTSNSNICQGKWNADTFHELYKAYYKALAGYACMITDNAEASEDIVQDMFSELWEKQLRFPCESSLRTYMYKNVRHQALDYVRHRGVEADYRKKVTTLSSAHHIISDGGNDFFSEEVYRRLFAEIDSLPERQRQVFLLAMKGKKYKEIANELQISVETVKTQKQRGMETLRKRLKDDSILLLLLLLTIE